MTTTEARGATFRLPATVISHRVEMTFEAYADVSCDDPHLVTIRTKEGAEIVEAYLDRPAAVDDLITYHLPPPSRLH